MSRSRDSDRCHCFVRWYHCLGCSLANEVNAFQRLRSRGRRRFDTFEDFRLHVSSSALSVTHVLDESLNAPRAFRWPADKSDGLGATSRVSQETSCDVRGGPITSVSNPSDETIRKYFDEAMRNCTSRVPDSRKARALIFLGRYTCSSRLHRL